MDARERLEFGRTLISGLDRLMLATTAARLMVIGTYIDPAKRELGMEVEQPEQFESVIGNARRSSVEFGMPASIGEDFANFQHAVSIRFQQQLRDGV